MTSRATRPRRQRRGRVARDVIEGHVHVAQLNTQRVELRNVHVTFYDVAGNPTSTLTSREGTDHWRTDDMEARGNVVVVRDKDGGTMRTEVMTYNRVRNEVSSDKSFVWDEPGRHAEGDGFTSDPEFKNITAKRPHPTRAPLP